MEQASVNIVVLGKDGTGKTALIVRLLTKRFIHEYDPTLEHVYAFSAALDGEQVNMNLMDTAGKDAPTVSEAEWGQGFMLLVSLTCRASLEHAVSLGSWLQAQGKPFVLVATKTDLMHDRQVSTLELQQLSHRWQVPFFETSATGDYEDVARPFAAVWRGIRTWNDRKALFPNVSTPLSPDEYRRYKTRQMTK
ncbi:ras-related and estrogen-regulated growth inhibitor-like isoform X2 [Ornithodoros turicata]